MNERWEIGLTSGEESNVLSTRASYRVFPLWSSRFWAWLTGKPDHDQKPLLQLTPVGYATCSVPTYVSGLALAIDALRLDGASSIAALLLGWALAVNGARRMVSTVAHQCIHRRFTGDLRVDFAVANCMAIMTLTQSAKDYHEEHFRLHHHAVFSSSRDPAGVFLLQAGFRPGTSVRSLWLRLAVTLVSPRFHVSFFWVRLRSLVNGLSWPVRLIALCLWAAFFAGAFVLLPTYAGILALVIPLTLLYQNSVLLEFISEHAWFTPPDSSTLPKYIHATHSWGRFCGRRMP